MTPELDKQLCEKYPKIFRDRHADMRTTCMCWGISVGDGWYDLIDNLCSVIQNHIDCQQRQHDYILEYNSTTTNQPHEVPPKPFQVVASQVKEKFGGLCFYVNGSNDYVSGAIDLAGCMSHRICEECGSPGKTQGPGWLLTLCDEHAKSRNSLVNVS